MAREVYLCAAQSPHTVNIELLRQGLHETPADLRIRLQSQINAAAGQEYDAVVLAYGLCGKSTEGLVARDVPMIIPRAHDCITLLLGSRKRYQQEFDKQPGTYWFANGYVERGKRVGSTLPMGAAGLDTREIYEQYVTKYGKDNADYLMEVMGAWSKYYTRAAFIDLGVGEEATAERVARENAQRRGWTFERITGDLVLIRRLLEGDWGNDFLILKPGEQITASHDEQIICKVEKSQ